MNQDESDSTIIVQELEKIKSTESFVDLVAQFGLEPILECMAQHEIKNSHFCDLDFTDIELVVEGKILELNGNQLLGYLNYGSWNKIPLELLKQRPEIFDDAEFLKGFLRTLEEWFENGLLGDIFEDETISEILSILVNGNENLKPFLNTMLRLEPWVVERFQDDEKEKVVSNPVYQEGVSKGIVDDYRYYFGIIIECAKYSEFTKSKIVQAAIESQKELTLKKIESGFYFSDMGYYYPWDIFWLSRFPCLTKDVINIMDQMKPYIAHCCYREGMEYVDRSGNYETLSPGDVIEKIVDIPLFLQDPYVQLGIAKQIRNNPGQNWRGRIESKDYMKSNPLILAALHLPIGEDAMRSLVQQINESKVPLFTIQEVLMNKQFRKRGAVMDAIKGRIPDIVTQIEEIQIDQGDWDFDLYSLVMYIIADTNLLEYTEIKAAVETRLPEIHQILEDWHPEIITKINEKLIDKSDPAGQLWDKFPDISSLAFLVDGDGLHLVSTNNLPEEFPGEGGSGFRVDSYEHGYNLAPKIRAIADSGSENTVRILLLILDKLMTEVSRSTWVHAKIAGGYGNYTPASVWYEVRNWVIVHLRGKMSKDEIDKIMEQYKYKGK